jgi:hypothetical protein
MGNRLKNYIKVSLPICGDLYFQLLRRDYYQKGNDEDNSNLHTGRSAGKPALIASSTSAVV